LRTLTDQLTRYADYHRDGRNLATHCIGVPMIVVAMAVLLARPVLLEVGGIALSPALAAVVATTVYYLRLDVRYGAVMGGLLGLSLWAGQVAAALPTAQWLGWGIGLFVVGWIIQFIGHAFEGRKPAFVDDVMGLLIGPLFVTAEIGFMLGLRRPLRDAVQTRLGAMPRHTTRRPAAA
jgi:uncharacterized membrane protein YGL010W